ncbi:MAG: homocysteine S-methyltransferase family protein [Labilithrix sp.]|nr:homocysteine S-methyltransferase family protein [Labilithrix sp.]MCW5809934.1 homocysteine S-methyltransferase family protein [Labilithrix sp.]
MGVTLMLLDGPMGTELERRGVSTEGRGWSAYAIDAAPDVVRSIHEDYVRAGAELHRANTFRTQPGVFPVEWRVLLGKAVRLAREAAGSRVIGSIAPVEDCYRPELSPSSDEARRAHDAVARAFVEEGISRVVCETFPHAGEARVAVECAVRAGLETWVALTAGPDGALMTPAAMEVAARDCVAAGASAVLVCCTGAEITRSYVERIAKVGAPFGAYANGYGVAPDRYAALAAEWVRAGAGIVGACCGTGPAHVARLRSLGA